MIELKNETKKIDELQFAEYNPRQISEHDFGKLVESIKTFGFVEPVVVTKDHTRSGGHMRVRAATELGYSEVPAVVIDIPKYQEKALNLALNRIHGEWDEDKLAELIYELKDQPEIDLTGFEDKEISKLLDSISGEVEEEFDPEKELEKITEPTAKYGDIYLLGNHRLMCGDSTKIEDVEALMGEEKADMVWTDPPYNVNYSSTNEKLGNILNDHMSSDDFSRFLTDVFTNYAAIMKDGAAIYCCCGWSSYEHFKKTIMDSGIKQSGCIIWVKNNASMGWNDYRYKHEWVIKGQKKKDKKAVGIFYGWKEGTHFFRDTMDEFDVWEVDKKSNNKYVHPTEKPDWLVMRAVKNSSKAKAIVVDLFTGSGSALMACEKTGRTFYGMELDPRFIDVIIARWERYTKSKAVKQ